MIQAFYQIPNIYKAVLVLLLGVFSPTFLLSHMHTASCHSTVSGPNRTLVVLLHYKLTSSGSVFALTYSRSHPPAARLYTGDSRHLLAHCIKHLSFCCLAYFLLRCSRPRSRRSSSSRALENTGELGGKGCLILWLSHRFYNYWIFENPVPPFFNFHDSDISFECLKCDFNHSEVRVPHPLSLASMWWTSSSLWLTSDTSSWRSRCSLCLWAWDFCHSAPQRQQRCHLARASFCSGTI